MSRDSANVAASKADHNSKGDDLPDIALKWGLTPKTSSLSVEEEKERQQALEHYYTEEEKEKMRARGINPLLKAEMNINKTKEGSFWSKMGGTAMGGGFIR